MPSGSPSDIATACCGRGPARPDREQRELRRTLIIRERASESNRIAEVLEGTNIKLGQVSTNLTGVSGRSIMAAITESVTDPEALAGFARGKLRSKHHSLVARFAGWCLTVECDRARRWAAALSDTVSRTAVTTSTSRSVARAGGRDRRVKR